jgi:RND family efflux transporter MFP subunit
MPHRPTHRRPLLACLALAMAATLATTTRAQDALRDAPIPTGANGVVSVTKPSQDVTVAFARPGLVAKLLVKKGDSVKAGDIVAQQDDTEEQAAYDVAKSEADDNTRVVAQEKIRDQKKSAYERKLASGVANQTELDEARLDWEVGVANVTLSNFEHLQAGKKAKQALAALEKTKLRTPISGFVEDTMIHEGETADSQNMKVLRVVNINPLWIDVPVPFKDVRPLHKDGEAKVRFSDGSTRSGKITNIHFVADPGSETLYVTVEVPNPQLTPAGEHVEVQFPSAGKVAAAGAR